MDTPVTKTDDDALAARASAVKLGYWQDEAIRHFCKTAERKAPVINRGTFLRTNAIDQVCARFLQAPGTQCKQIISLGAGSDTRFFRLIQQYKNAQAAVPFCYHELDFPHVTQRKALTMTMKRPLKELLSYRNELTVDARAGSIFSSTYNLHPIDLRDLATIDQLQGIDYSLPTLILSEVCLIYMEIDDVDAVVAWTKRFANRGLLIFEPIGGNDAFGQMMVKNLAGRGLQLKTLTRYATRCLQQRRLHQAGLLHAHTLDMNDLEQDLSDAEKGRIARIEMFDEVEEWRLLAAHYCFAEGWCGPLADWMLPSPDC